MKKGEKAFTGLLLMEKQGKRQKAALAALNEALVYLNNKDLPAVQSAIKDAIGQLEKMAAL